MIISGFMLGWTAMHRKSRIAIMTVFAVMAVVVTLYITLVTRPRFRVPKEARGSNRPDAYLMGEGAFDPEMGRSVNTNPMAPANNPALR